MGVRDLRGSRITDGRSSLHEDKKCSSRELEISFIEMLLSPPAWVGKIKALRLVVASPADTLPERNLVPVVVQELNNSVCADRAIRIEAVRWETDTYPGFHPEGPQGLIVDPILRIEGCDLLIGIFWKRFWNSH